MNIDQVVGHRKVRPTPDFLRHARKCCICRHPRREEIESDFLVWRNPRQIMREYGLAHHAAIYRHAHATGLATRRRENAYSALDSIVEQIDDVQVTATSSSAPCAPIPASPPKDAGSTPQSASSTKPP